MTNSKEYYRKYYQEHKDKIISRVLDYNKENKEQHRASARECARKSYARSKQSINTSMYMFDSDVEILDERHVKYNRLTYVINKNGYFSHKNKFLHIELCKDSGIWFETCEVHHIDGNSLNNQRTNLIALLPEEHDYAHKLLKESKKQYYNWIADKKVG